MEKKVVEGLQVRSVKCRSFFCACCCQSKAKELRRKLIKAMESWQHVYMLTLTIDPDHFDNNAEAAFRYCREKRVISEMVRALVKEGHIENKQYVCVVEWQKQSGFPHWHLLVDAKYIEIRKAREIWNRNIPEWSQQRRAGFGNVHYSKTRKRKDSRKRQFDNRLHGLFYITKYLTKVPREGFPQWVMDFDGKIARYQTARGMMHSHKTTGIGSLSGSIDKFSENQRWANIIENYDTYEEYLQDITVKRRGRSPREITDACQMRSVIVEVRTSLLDDKPSFKFVRSVDAPFAELVRLLKIENLKRSYFYITEEEKETITEYCSSYLSWQDDNF